MADLDLLVPARALRMRWVDTVCLTTTRHAVQSTPMPRANQTIHLLYVPSVLHHPDRAVLRDNTGMFRPQADPDIVDHHQILELRVLQDSTGTEAPVFLPARPNALTGATMMETGRLIILRIRVATDKTIGMRRMEQRQEEADAGTIRAKVPAKVQDAHGTLRTMTERTATMRRTANQQGQPRRRLPPPPADPAIIGMERHA